MSKSCDVCGIRVLLEATQGHLAVVGRTQPSGPFRRVCFVVLVRGNPTISALHRGHPDALDTAEYVSSRVASSSISTAFVGIVATTLPSLAG